MAVAAATASAVSPGLQLDGEYSKQELEDLVKRLTKLRDDVVAGLHPKYKAPRSEEKGRLSDATTNVSATPLQTLPSNAPKPPPFLVSVTKQTTVGALPEKPPNVSPQNVAPVQQFSSQASATPKLDPLFLTKADVVIQAEFKQRRQRLERALADQVQQKSNLIRYKTFEHDALPDFDVGETLRKAQEVLKPARSHHANVAVGGTSSADSFDDRTFYSSQMNESTTTEEIEESKRARPTQLCRFFLNGKPCPYGENCIFPHDPAVKQKLNNITSRPSDFDNVNEKTVKERDDRTVQFGSDKSYGERYKGNHSSTALSQQQERIAQLEAELRAIKEGKPSLPERPSSATQRENPESQDDSAYSPPGPDEFGRDVSLRDRNVVQMRETQHSGHSGDQTSQRYEFQRTAFNHSPPSPNEVPVIRNHITSPYAPQPARVSPLAVVKESHGNQNPQNPRQVHSTSHTKNLVGFRSPHAPEPFAPMSKKRRRGPEPDEPYRNVMPRREVSPEVRIKQEPVSPDPFDRPQPRRPNTTLEPPQQVRLSNISPQYQPQERVIYQNRSQQRPVRVYEADDRPRPAPLTARTVSRNGQYHVSHDEPDLRRVVSEKSLRVPASPAPYLNAVSDREPRIIRKEFRNLERISPAQGEIRSSTQPHFNSSAYRPSVSPTPRERPPSPTGSQSIIMAPPRRILVDQYGNRFLAPSERQIFLAPQSYRAQTEASYEQPLIRSASYRAPLNPDQELANAPDYERGLALPGSSQYLERQPRHISRQPQDLDFGDSPYDPRQPGPQIIYRDSRQPPSYEPMGAPRENVVRVQSVRPGEEHYATIQEQIPRVASVRPQARIIQLNERRAASPIISRQTSVRAFDGYSPNAGFAEDEQRPYQYQNPPQEREYPVHMEDDGVYRVPGRQIQHL